MEITQGSWSKAHGQHQGHCDQVDRLDHEQKNTAVCMFVSLVNVTKSEGVSCLLMFTMLSISLSRHIFGTVS